MCLHPYYLKSEGIPVPCGKCQECRQKRANEWACRMMAEYQVTQPACMITLTYDNEKIPKNWLWYNHCFYLNKKDLQDFNKRLRKAIKLPIKYFACGEYGGRNKRPHFHEVIFGYDFPDKREFGKGYTSEMLDEIWKYGQTYIVDANEQSMEYCALYCTPEPHEYERGRHKKPEFNTMSRGLGMDWLTLNSYKFTATDEVYINGKSYPIPRRILDEILYPIDRYYINPHTGLTRKNRRNEQEYLALKEERKQQYINKACYKDVTEKKLKNPSKSLDSYFDRC